MHLRKDLTPKIQRAAWHSLARPLVQPLVYPIVDCRSTPCQSLSLAHPLVYLTVYSLVRSNACLLCHPISLGVGLRAAQTSAQWCVCARFVRHPCSSVDPWAGVPRSSTWWYCSCTSVGFSGTVSSYNVEIKSQQLLEEFFFFLIVIVNNYLLLELVHLLTHPHIYSLLCPQPFP